MGVAIGCLVFLLTFYRRLLMNKDVISLVWHRLLRWGLLFAVIGNCEYLLFAWSTKFVDISVTTVVYEIWPLFLILLVERLYREEERFRPISKATLILLMIAFLGLCLVMVGQIGSFELLFSQDLPLLHIVVGVMLALGAALLAPLMAFGFRWGSDLAVELVDKLENRGERDLEMLCAAIAFLVSSSGSAVLNTGAGLVSGESMGAQTLLVAVLGGALTNAVAGIAWRKVNFTTTNLGVNSLAYMTPVVSLMFLIIFSQVHIPRPDYLIIGTASVMTANILINFEAEIRLGFKALIIALWTCGAFVYLRDDFLHFLPFDNWLWPGEPFLGALGLSATVFTLLLSFRVARLAQRTQEEDNTIFLLFQNIDLLARRGVINEIIREHILAIDGSHAPDELQRAYREARICFIQATAANPPVDDLARLAEAESQLNTIVHSRRHGIEFGELFAFRSSSAE